MFKVKFEDTEKLRKSRKLIAFDPKAKGSSHQRPILKRLERLNVWNETSFRLTLWNH